MRSLFARIGFPALIVGIAAAGAFGTGTVKTSGLCIQGPGARDSVIKDKIVTHFDLRITNDSSYINSLEEEKTLSARDTIKVPDSLKTTDPFRYKYYIAIKDQFTHIQTRDSLLKAGDSLSVSKLDSLYIADSTITARNSFQVWFNSLSKKEKKKYLYEQMIPVRQHRTDSLLAVKDSLKDIRDSIMEAKPRILETFAIPDSMQYKRIISWTHDRYFHKTELHDIDTSFNYHFNDFPFMRNGVNATFLGVAGSAAQPFDYFKRTDNEGVSFYRNLESWTYSPSTLPMFNTKTAYTELGYFGTQFANTEKEEDNIHVFTTQNILPQLNVTLSYDRFGGGGMLDNETTRNKTFYAASNYLGKKYLMHAGYIYNMADHDENGGIIDNSLIRDTTIDAREINVRLASAENLVKKNTVFLDQEYRIPFNFINKLRESKAAKADEAYRDSVMATGDSTLIAAMEDTLATRLKKRNEVRTALENKNENITTAFIGHSSEYSVYRKVYTDDIELSDTTGRNFYNNQFYYNPTESMDSMRVMKLENRIFIKLQPWSNEAILSKLNAGIGNKIQSFYKFDPSYLYKSENAKWNSTYIYAGAEGQLKNYFNWDAVGAYTFMGDEINDFSIKGNMGFNFYPFRLERKSPVSTSFHFETSLKEPYYYEQHFFSNHYKWENDFDKVSSTKLTAKIGIPKWNMNIEAGYALLKNNIYYDSLGIVRQNASPMSILSLAFSKNFTLFNTLHLENKALFQTTSNADVLPLPAAALNLRYYFQFYLVKNVLNMQVGMNTLYNTEWYAPAYNPESGTFMSQHKEQYGNCPYIDAFVNMQWKRACIFVKVENIGMGWPMDKADYFSAAGYIRPQRSLKFGIFWPFYTTSSKNPKIGDISSGLGGNKSANTTKTEKSAKNK
ncbi:MAG: putative porin [Bacteroidales bacterium]|jgi:hypothetical protein|nr:putative porin [Bacteroidales bacterium]MCI1785185.1 putative porin [Bacteroidales bacterium]